MKVKEIAKKIADLLYSMEHNKGVIYFDFKSYDNPLDIPSLIIDGELIPIEEFRISENGNKIVVLDDDCNVYTLEFDKIPDEWNDDYFDEIGMFELFRDVYYETENSSEIGDYEMDFLEIE